MPVDLALPLISGGNGPNKNGRTLSARGAFLPGHIFDALLGVRRLTGGPPIISFSIPVIPSFTLQKLVLPFDLRRVADVIAFDVRSLRSKRGFSG